MIKFSIITVCFNSVNTICNCLDSLYSQNYSNYEHIIIDGGSTDGTYQLILKNKFNRTIIVTEPDNGIYDALNKGLGLCTGDVVGFLHSDDFYNGGEVLKKVSMVFHKNPDTSSVYGDLDYVSSGNVNKLVRSWKSSDFKISKLKNGWMPPHPSFFVRRCWYKKINFFNSEFRISADYLSVIKLVSDPLLSSHDLPEVIVNMRVGGKSNNSLTNIYIKTFEDYRVLRLCGYKILSAVYTIICKNLSKIHQFL